MELPAFLLRADAALAPAWWGGWDARRLWTPRWGTPQTVWLSYRLFFALYALVVSSIGRAISTETSDRYIAYLTLQGVWLAVCYLWCQVAVGACVAVWPSLRDIVEPTVGTPQPHVTLTPLQRATWVGLVRATQLLWCIALPFEVSIVTTYWLLLAQPDTSQINYWSNVEHHGIKLAMLLFDLLVSSMRLPDVHLIATSAAIVGYIITNAWVTLTQYPVYGILTWRTPISVVLVGGVAGLVVLGFFGASLVAMLRDKAARRNAGGAALFRDEVVDEYNGPCACCCCCCRRRHRIGSSAAAAAVAPAAALAFKVPGEGNP